MESIAQEMTATRMFRNLAPEQIEAIAGLGEEVEFADGHALMVEGDAADSFFLIRDGFVALEIQAPAGTITIETLHNGDPVGWSWLFEPYLTHFDARSRGVTRAIRFDAAALRRRMRGGRPAGLPADAQLHVRDRRTFARDTPSTTRYLWQRQRRLSHSRPPRVR